MDKASLQRISEIGTQLGQRTRLNKDFIVKSLRQAADALSELEQSPQPQTPKEVLDSKKREAALQPLANAMIRGLLRHADKDVKLLVGICVTELFRVMAPEPPFEGTHLRDVFELLIAVFADLADTASPFFSKRAKILDTVAKLRCCVIMLEIGSLDLVFKMFNIFFSVVRDDNHDSLIKAMSSIMINILNESEEASQQLLEVILQNLIKGKKDATCVASQLAASVIKTCAQEEELNPLVCRFLTSCIQNRDAVGCELKESYHEIIFKVFQCAPQMLLAVIPSLIEELLADQVDVRIKAVHLVGKLFALPGYHVVQKYHDLFLEFLKRFSDKSVDVRVSALQYAKAFYVENPSGRESHEIITAVEDRLLDFDDRVRMQAVIVSCDLSMSNLKLVPSKLLSQATERLRDKKISVRKKALQKLIEVYHDYCKKCCEGSMIIGDHFEDIPCKIMMLFYDKDCKEFRSQNMEYLLADDLFPEGLSIEERTKHWIHMFSLFSSLHEKALNTILIQKRRLQHEMKNYLAMRNKMKEIYSEETQKKTESMFKKMAASFPDPHKAEECLNKLNKLKDNNVFKSLEQLLEEQTFMTRRAIQDKLLEMIGDSNPYYEFLCSLFSRCSYNMFSSEHVHCILLYISKNASGNKHLEDSSVNLLLAIVRVFPLMLKGLEEQFQMLLKQERLDNDKLIEILARAGSHSSFNLSDVYPFIRRMCLNGTRTQAKFAVSAVAALSSEQSVFLNLYEGLIDSLYSQLNVPTVLQSLGCIAQYSVSTFESQDENITSYISRKIIQMEHMDDGHEVTSLDGTSHCSDSCQLKIYGLKTLVKSFLPHQGNYVRRNINFLLGILSRMLHESSDNFVGTNPGSCERDKAHIRLAAAKSILRLSKKWDVHITPDIFRFTILIARDPCSFVRSSFLKKTQKMLKEHKLPIKYACTFALGATHSNEDMQYHSYNYMAEFIKNYSKVAHKRQTSAVQEAIVDYPAYIMVFLIHVLAQSSDFPFEGCQDEKLYADICSPLFFVLQVLVDVNIVDGDVDLVNDAVLNLFSIFRAIKKAEDAVDVQLTPKLHMLAEIGLYTLSALTHGAISASHAPGQILLPSSLYRFNIAKNDDYSKCQSFCDKGFLCRIFHIFKSNAPPACAQKPTQSIPDHGRKGQEDTHKSNIYDVVDLASSYPEDVLKRATTAAKIVRTDVTSGHRRKHMPPTGSGSVGLHECSTIEKPKKFASRHCENTSERNQLSSCGSVSFKGLSESHVLTRKLKRAAASTENAVKSSKHTLQPFKCPRTNLKGTCGSKKQDVLEDVSNKIHFSHCDPGEHSSLSSIKNPVATTGGLLAKQGTSLNQKIENVDRWGKCTETSASEVVNVNLEAGIRSRRRV